MKLRKETANAERSECCRVSLGGQETFEAPELRLWSLGTDHPTGKTSALLMWESAAREPVDTEDCAQREEDKFIVGSKVLKGYYLELDTSEQNKSVILPEPQGAGTKHTLFPMTTKGGKSEMVRQWTHNQLFCRGFVLIYSFTLVEMGGPVY